jgi:chloramphenicol 3-O phosphotransferase
MDLATGPGEYADAGLWFEQTPSGRRLRVGPTCRQLIEVYHQWVSAAVRSGMNVIVDDVVIDRETYESWERVLEGLEPVWVAVRCPVEVAEARELIRGDRAIGLARAQHELVHRDISYAFDIDTGDLTATEAHETLRRHLGL